MNRWLAPLAVLAPVLLAPLPSTACSLCGPGLKQTPTFREDASRSFAKIILYGSLSDPKLTSSGGSTTLKILSVVRGHPSIEGKKEVVLPRYLPVSDPKDPPRFLIFCDYFMDRLDPYRGVPVKSEEVIEYVKRGIELNGKDPASLLGFYFGYLEHPDPEIARDAFIEFAKTSDRDIALAASKYDPDKLRRWLVESRTPEERLGVYAFMLGACGTEGDAEYLRGLLAREEDDRIRKAYSGVLSGYLVLKPREGWDLLLSLLRDGRKSLEIRLAAVGALRFLYGADPEKNAARALRGVEIMIAQGELADMAIEDLRRWKMWTLTREVLALYGKKGYDTPIVQRTILRYALCCPQDAAVRQFVADRRRLEPETVQDIEDQLQLEKP